MARWKICLEQEENETTTEVVGNDKEEEIDSLCLKTASARLDAIRKEVHEAFPDKEDAPAPSEPDAAQRTTEDAPAAKDAPIP